MSSYAYSRFPYRIAPELTGEAQARRPVAIIGSGPVGLTCAIDLATRGIPSVVLDDNDMVSNGSRAICWAKRTLEIWDRLGVGARMVEKGVTWSTGRVFHGDREVYHFDLLPETGHRRPAFINLQQYYVEQYLVERALEFPELIDLRWKHEVVGHSTLPDGVRLDVGTPDGAYRLDAEWVIAADGARSPMRNRMGLTFEGQAFEERFLIADVRMNAAFPPERLFWFEPTFHAGQSALLHRQPDSIFRIDFQLGPNADPEREKQPDRVMKRVQAIVGPDTEIELEWCSVYSFRCAKLQRFVHGRVIFAGDSAHVVSPFGARGGNGGVQDADNLCWKLAAVAKGDAPESLIDTYDEERGHGSRENIKCSSRTTNFMTPKTAAERHLRDGVLALAERLPFARTLLNAGRLSEPCSLEGLSLQQPFEADAQDGLRPGQPCLDAPVRSRDGETSWLLDHLGPMLTVLTFLDPDASREDQAYPSPGPDLRLVAIANTPIAGPAGFEVLLDPESLVRRRYAGVPGTTYLIRPDQHVAARFTSWDAAAIADAIKRVLGPSGRLMDQAA